MSVLIPVYNAGDTLKSTLDSVRRQTLTDWECLLCDDGSTDETVAIAQHYAAIDARFTVIQREHAGLVATLNAGLQLCQAAYVARLDADDICHRERLVAQLSTLERHPEFSGIGCAVRMFPRSGLGLGRREYEAWLNGVATEADILRDRFVECPLGHPTWFFKREVLLEFGYKDCDWPEDYDLLLRLLGAGHRLSTVPRRLVCWRDSKTRLSRIDQRYATGAFTRCRAHFLASEWLSGESHYALWGYGSTGKALARALAYYGKRPSFIVELHPGRIGQRILGVPVVAPSQLQRFRQAGERLVISVAGVGPRTEARRIAMAQGLVECVDFICAA